MINRDSLSIPVVKCQDEFVDLSRQKDLTSLLNNNIGCFEMLCRTSCFFRLAIVKQQHRMF